LRVKPAMTVVSPAMTERSSPWVTRWWDVTHRSLDPVSHRSVVPASLYPHRHTGLDPVSLCFFLYLVVQGIIQ
jgi:hypothetical protein